MAKIQSRNSSTKSTKLGTSAPKAPSFTKEQSAYVAGLLTGRGMGASGGGTGFMPVSGDVYDPGLAPVSTPTPADIARNQSIANETPLLDPMDPRQAQANTVALEREQNPTGYLPKYGQNSPFAAQAPAKDPILTEGPKWYDSIYDGMDQLLSGKAFKEQNERYSVDPAKVGEVDMISSATNTVSAAREPKPNPAQGKIETPEDAATYWATELPAWLKPKIAYDENNEPYVTMHAAVMQRMMIASMYGGMAQSSRNNADRIEQEAMQGVSPEVVQGTHDAQYTINQLAQNAPRGTQHTGPYGYGQQQYAVTTAQGDPYEASFVKMLQQQYPQLTTAEILRILRGQ